MRLALATHDPSFAPETAEDRALLAAIRGLGVSCERLAWTDAAVDWARFEVVLVRSTWDYTLRLPEFRAWLARVDGLTRLRNPLAMILGNLDKRYLLGLGAVPVVPTRPLSTLDAAALEAAAAELGARELVLKPSVGVGGRGLVSWAPGQGLPALEVLPEGACWLAQPLLSTIREAGELSVIWVGGAPLLTLQKRPAAGEIRIHEEYGGREEVVGLSEEARGLCEAALGALDATPVVARVDMLWDEEGRLRLSELELIEPSLYLQHMPERVDEVARRIVKALA